MPRLNEAGKATTGFCRTWFDEERTIGYNQPDGDLRIKLSDGAILAGPLAISAGPYGAVGHWAAETSDGVLYDGKLIGPGTALASYLDPIGPDGTLIVKRNRNSYGPWGFVGGTDIGGVGVDEARTITNYGGGRASWLDGNWTFRANFPCKWEGTRAYNYRLKGEDFLWQSADGGALVLNGRVIAPGGPYYRPDFMVLGPGTYRVVWSAIEGEPNVSEIFIRDLAGYPTIGSTVVEKPAPIVIPNIPTTGGHMVSDQSAHLKTIRAKYPTPLGPAHGAFLIEGAKAVGAKLLVKDSGTNVTLPDGRKVSQDIFIFGDTGVDVLSDGEGAAVVVWGVKEESFAGRATVDPGDFASQGPIPVPTPTPAGISLAEVQAAIDATSAAIHKRIDKLQELINLIDNRAGIDEENLADLRKALTDGVRSERSGYGPLAHSHVVKFVV